MKNIFFLLFLFCGFIANGQQYNLPKAVKMAILRGFKTFKKEELFIEITQKEGNYLVNVKKINNYSNDKKNKIKKSSRFIMLEKTKFFIWFHYDDLFCKMEPGPDIEGGGVYTIEFDYYGKVVDEYKQQ